MLAGVPCEIDGQTKCPRLLSRHQYATFIWLCPSRTHTHRAPRSDSDTFYAGSTVRITLTVMSPSTWFSGHVTTFPCGKSFGLSPNHFTTPSLFHSMTKSSYCSTTMGQSNSIVINSGFALAVSA